MMITVNLSIDQLAEVVRNLSDDERDQIKQILVEDDYAISSAQENILMERHAAYLRGEMKTYTVDELKKRLNYTEE